MEVDFEVDILLPLQHAIHGRKLSLSRDRLFVKASISVDLFGDPVSILLRLPLVDRNELKEVVGDTLVQALFLNATSALAKCDELSASLRMSQSQAQTWEIAARRCGDSTSLKAIEKSLNRLKESDFEPNHPYHYDKKAICSNTAELICESKGKGEGQAAGKQHECREPQQVQGTMAGQTLSSAIELKSERENVEVGCEAVLRIKRNRADKGEEDTSNEHVERSEPRERRQKKGAKLKKMFK